MVSEKRIEKLEKQEGKIVKDIDKNKRIFAAGVLILLAIFLIYALAPYVNAFFGAIIFFVLLRPIHKYLTEKRKWKKELSAWLLLILSIFIILVPVVFIVNLVITETQDVINSKEVFIEGLQKLDEKFPQFNIGKFVDDLLPEVLDFLKRFVINLFQETGRLFIVLIIMYFTLYYLFVHDKWLEDKIYAFIPFTKKNSQLLLNEFKNITYSTIFATGIIAIIQGGLLTIAFLIFGVNGAFLWGFVAAVLSFLPIVGPPIIWVPAVILKVAQNNIPAAIGLLIFGLFISNIDNFLRPYIQRRVGKIHPLVSIIGIFMGVAFFGLLGIVIGPLLLTYFLLLVKMFKEEYFDSKS